MERLLAVFQEGTREDVVKAVESVQRAFPMWKKFPPPKRAAILLRAGQRLKSKAPRVLWEKEAGNRTKPLWKFKVAGTIPHHAFTGAFGERTRDSWNRIYLPFLGACSSLAFRLRTAATFLSRDKVFRSLSWS